MSYESPVSIYTKAVEKLRDSFDDAIHEAIEIKTGIKVDRDELIKALQYDRDQYKKGYADGQKDGYVQHGYWKRPYPTSTKSYVRICSVCEGTAYVIGVTKYQFCPHCMAKMDGTDQDDEKYD